MRALIGPRNLTVFAAFASGAVTVAFAIWLPASLRAQTGSSTTIETCVTPDGLMRFVRPPASCGPDEKHLSLLPMAATAQSDPGVESLKRRIADVERRIKDLEDAASRGELGNVAVEPFVVKNPAGKVVFGVSKNYADGGADVAVSNNNGALMAGIRAPEEGAWFYLNSRTIHGGMQFGVQGRNPHLTMDENDVTRVDLGRDGEKGNYRLKVFDADKTLAAGLGQSESGPGVAVVAKRGVYKAMLRLSNDLSGRTAVFVTEGKELLHLTAADNGRGGVLRLFTAGGLPVVEAVAGPGGFGVVSTGPLWRPSGIGLVGPSGSYIAGKP